MWVFPLLVLIALLTTKPRVSSLRQAALVVGTVLGVGLLATTETLSAFRAIGFAGVAAAWSILIAAVALWAWRRWRWQRSPRPRAWRLTAIGFRVAAASILGLTLAVALLSAPNNWDSMTYHLARVAVWANQKSVAAYPTRIVRQLFSFPWAEFALLHLYVLLRGDAAVALVQWLAFAGALAGATSLVAHLGFSARQQRTAALALMSTPMVLLQSTSTQNDLVAGFWLVAGASLLFVLDDSLIPLGAAATALAFATKPPAVLFGLPLLLLWALRYGSTSSILRAGESLALIGAVTTLLVLPHASRNLATFGDPFGPQKYVRGLANDRPSGGAAISNALRGLALHLGTGAPAIDQRTISLVDRAHAWLGLDARDPRTSYVAEFAIPAPSRHEDDAGNPLQVFLFFAAAIALAVRPSLRRALPVWLAVALGFVAFAAVVKWQPWASRLQVPGFVLAAVPIGIALGGIFRRENLLAAVFFAASLPWLLSNQTRPLVPLATRDAASVLVADRETQTFANRPALRAPFQHAADLLHARSGREPLCLLSGEDGWEYPLWALARRRGDDPAFVPVASEADLGPCTLLLLDDIAPHDAPPGWQVVWQEAPLALLSRAP